MPSRIRPGEEGIHHADDKFSDEGKTAKESVLVR